MRKLKVKLKDLCFKKPFYKHLYQHIKDEFAYNNKTAIRYYMENNILYVMNRSNLKLNYIIKYIVLHLIQDI